MASARCETCGQPQGLKHKYPYLHTPVPPSNFLCGAPACALPAFVWLTEEEEQKYLNGERSFRLSNHAVHVQLT